MNGAQIALDFTGATLVPAARRRDPATSHEAAKMARVGASTGRVLVLRSLATMGPATDFELADRTGWQQTSIGKRRGECVFAGWVRAHATPEGKPITRPSPSGSRSMTWELTDDGRRKLREIEATQ